MEKSRSARPITNTHTSLPPFLKWAGGKRWFADAHPHLLDVQFTRFVEPFLGSGAVYFRLAPAKALLSDLSPDLILTYRAIRDEWPEVVARLKYHHRHHNKEYYYFVRKQGQRSNAARAAQFIYLNRTCWNGLYRVNLKGVFNVPIGTKSNVVLASDSFEQIATLLSNAELRSCDFQQTLEQATAGDFVFADPPYTVKHNHNGFIKYNEGLFSWEDQVRLRDAVVLARKRGAKVLVTNAYHDCIRDLYRGIGEQLRLVRRSVIAGKSASRGKFDEMVIKCF